MFPPSPAIVADIVALDANDRPVLYAELKRDPQKRDDGRTQLEEMLSGSTPETVKFAMLVDAKTIEIFHWDGQSLISRLVIPTFEVFAFYNPEINTHEIFEAYMGRLVEGWLRDVAYHWKSEEPPYVRCLEEIGLAQLLIEGTTLSEVPLSAA